MQVKALPWFSAVRKKLDDPAFSGFFLKFNSTSGQPHVPRCDNRTSPPKCSIFYHDQLQSPEWNGTVDVHSLNDGNCTAGGCDCGKNPCGEYLYDHRNGSMLRQVRFPTHTKHQQKHKNSFAHRHFRNESDRLPRQARDKQNTQGSSAPNERVVSFCSPVAC